MQRRGPRHRRSFALALAIGAVVTGAPAGARPSSGPVVDLHTAGALAPDGSSITVQVIASCPVRSTVVEAVVAVSQQQASGRASFPLTCIGSLRNFTVVVPSSGGTFGLGDAGATASVTTEQGKTQSAQDAQVILVEPSVSVDIADTAELESGGGAVVIDVTVACSIGAVGSAESYLNVAQGQTASGTARYVPICDGQPHALTLRVVAAQGSYTAGEGRVLTFAVVEYNGTATAGVGDSPVQIVG